VAIAGAIAEFIRHHFYIMNISPSEAQLLNSSQFAGGVGVKTTVPEGWNLEIIHLKDQKRQAFRPHTKNTLFPSGNPGSQGIEGSER
jgi:hypothetical protein